MARISRTRAHTIEENVRTLLAILALAALPAALLAPWPEWAPRWPAVVIGLGAWGLFAAGYWERHVAPLAHIPPARPVTILPDIVPATRSGVSGDVIKNFRWTFAARDGQSVEMTLEVALSSERYQAVRAEPRRPAGNWAHYAATDMPELDSLAAGVYRLHVGREWSSLDQAGNVLNFTQACIRYVPDGESAPAAEWPRYPIETLMDEAGDCEDDVILAAAALKRLGFEVALLYYSGHCALGVAGAEGLPGEFVVDARTRLKYFYGETTDEGWRLGEVPDRYRGRQPDMIEPVHRVMAPKSS